jgi:hypothetical protein
MPKVRILIFLVTILIVASLALFASYYARGYKLNFKTLKFSPNGILVVNSEPNGAQIYIDDQLKTATSATISVAPGIYKIQVKKDGFLTWEKQMEVQKEVVTQIDAVLFPAAPSLSALTFAGVANPVVSPSTTKIAYAVPGTIDTTEKTGLWITEVATFPIGFNREPKRITDGDLTKATWTWSPDEREILLTIDKLSYLLDTTEFTPQEERVNVSNQLDAIHKRWDEIEDKKLTAQLTNLPDELETIFAKKADTIIFSPDEYKILYTASESATLPAGLVKELPGASTQKQTRDIKPGMKYVYDIKEDRNFEVANKEEITYWLPTSRHLIVPQKDKIVIVEYDGTNKQTVYSGSYIFPHAYPYSNAGKMLILTNLGATDSLPNLYSLNLK